MGTPNRCQRPPPVGTRQPGLGSVARRRPEGRAADHGERLRVRMISVLAPTRGRPDALQAMADSVYATATGPVEVLAYVDDDDPSDYSQVTGVRIVTGPRIVLSDCWNRLAAV